MKKLRCILTFTMPLSALEAEGMTEEQAIAEIEAVRRGLIEEVRDGVTAELKAEVIDE